MINVWRSLIFITLLCRRVQGIIYSPQCCTMFLGGFGGLLNLENDLVAQTETGNLSNTPVTQEKNSQVVFASLVLSVRRELLTARPLTAMLCVFFET